MHPFESLVVPDQSIGIHWFGQSSFALRDAAGTIVQVDPYFPRVRPAERFIHAEPPLDETSLRTDYVLLTHNHSDHTCSESLQRMHAAFPAARFVGPSESIATMIAHGIPAAATTTIAVSESTTLGSMTAHAVWSKPPQGAPDDGITPPDVQHFGYVVRASGVAVYISGDPINTFAEHDELLDPILALRPDIGLLTTHPTEGEFPFFDGSVAIANKLRLKTAVPSHYDCFTARTYDPQRWAERFAPGEPVPRMIPYNTAIVYPPEQP